MVLTQRNFNINQLSHITKQEFAENLIDKAAKVNGLVADATNAGTLGTVSTSGGESLALQTVGTLSNTTAGTVALP